MQKKKFHFVTAVTLAFTLFLLVACKPTNETLTSDAEITVKAIYIVQGEGQLTQDDLQSHPEVLVTNNFDDFKKFARSKVALWVDVNAVGLVDAEWFRERPQRFYPVVLVGIGDELCAFMETLWIVDLEGPGGYECNPPPSGFSVNIQTTDTGGNWHGYKQTPIVQGILDITNPLLEGIK